MIPEELLLKATQAYNANVGFDYASPLAMEAALEAVLPDIWDEAIDKAAREGTYLANPYRKEV